MREGGKILARILDQILLKIKAGAAAEELDKAAKALILQSGAKVAFEGYQGFPAALCVSINEEVVHGVPSSRILKEGDIVTIDIGLVWKGFYVDMARTVPVGQASPEALRLIRVAKKALRLGIKKVHPGATVGDIGNTIQRFVESQKFQIVRDLCGHGIGKDLHEDPLILNYGERHTGTELKEGMAICIEPMITMGDWHVKQAIDGFVFTTVDNSLAAHFEDTIAVTENGCEVLTS